MERVILAKSKSFAMEKRLPQSPQSLLGNVQLNDTMFQSTPHPPSHASNIC